MADIRMRQVNKEFGDVKVIQKVDLDIDDGEFAVFVGPSGCGKSTLLRLVAGLEDITSGDLFIGGTRCNDLPPSGRGVSMVFQSYALYPHMTIYENMAFGLKLAKEDKDTIDERVRGAAKMLQMEHLLHRLPKELSGGQRQRVAIGRSIVRRPGVFLFDEPLSNLDAALRVHTRIEIARLHASMEASMIYVTHDQVEAMTLADKIVLLNAGKAVLEDGSVAQVGHPLELYHHPVNLFVAGFIGSPKMNFIQGKLTDIKRGEVSVELSDKSVVKAVVDASSGKVGDTVTLGIRPEHVVLGTQEGLPSTKGKVVHVEQLGESSYTYTEVEGNPTNVVLRESGSTSNKADDMVSFSLPSQSCHLFNTQGRAFKRLIEKSAETKPVVQ